MHVCVHACQHLCCGRVLVSSLVVGRAASCWCVSADPLQVRIPAQVWVDLRAQPAAAYRYCTCIAISTNYSFHSLFLQTPILKEALKVFLKDIFNKKNTSIGMGTMVRTYVRAYRSPQCIHSSRTHWPSHRVGVGMRGCTAAGSIVV